MGVGGNCVLRACLDPSALDRFERGVLEREGVAWLILLEGVNDIGGGSPDHSAQVAQDLVAAYRAIADPARVHGIVVYGVVYGATIPPFGELFYDSPEREAARQTVSAWTRTSGAFDAVLDFDAALRAPSGVDLGLVRKPLRSRRPEQREGSQRHRWRPSRALATE